MICIGRDRRTPRATSATGASRAVHGGWATMNNQLARVRAKLSEDVLVVDPDAGVLRFRAVKSAITAALIAGEWKSGEAIPDQARLAARCGVSIGTLRKAIDELVAEKILIRRQGLGTFVAAHGPARNRFHFFHIVDADGGRELPRPELLRFARARAKRSNSGRGNSRPPSASTMWKKWKRLRAGPCAATNVPSPCRRIRIFSATSSSIALRNVPMLTPQRAASRAWSGMASPDFHSPAISAAVIADLTALKRSTPASGSTTSTSSESFARTRASWLFIVAHPPCTAREAPVALVARGVLRSRPMQIIYMSWLTS